MSEAPRHALISTPRQLIAVVIAAFAIPIIVIMLIISYIENTNQANAGKDATSNEAVSRRIEPVAHVAMAPATAAPAAVPASAAAASGAATTAETTAVPATGASAGVTQAGATSAGDTSTPPVAPVAGATAAAGTGATAAAGTGATAGAAAAPTADTQLAGKTLYTQVCQACHAAGLLGAPKFGDKTAWAPRLKDSIDVVYGYALHGKGAMPPKGGSNASDADVKAAVDYMVNAAK